MCPYVRRKSSGLSLSQLRKCELNYPTYYLELSIVKHGSTIFLEVKVSSSRITRIYRTSSLRWSWACDILIGMKLVITWKSAITSRSKVMADTLAMENCTKKVRVTPRTKSCIPSSSNLTESLMFWRWVVDSFLDQEDKEALLEGEYFKQENWYYGLKREGGLVIGVT